MTTILRMMVSASYWMLRYIAHLSGSDFAEVREALESAIRLAQNALSGKVSRADIASVRKELNEALDVLERRLHEKD